VPEEVVEDSDGGGPGDTVEEGIGTDPEKPDTDDGVVMMFRAGMQPCEARVSARRPLDEVVIR